ncbi:ATP-binding protein [Actinomadura rugatobispora]|uniref:ATP-binding protein n=1 Tax=Actinomadura rugatobispora TaxID=1994 RepID=A0ABW1A9X6_9ACTN|nr:ATP-binding protein [Actinomadura rugatobispora]
MASRAPDVQRSPREDPLAVLGAVVLPGVEPAVALVRRYARALLGPGFPGLYELTVVASELFTNAVRHSRSGRLPGDGGAGQVTITFLTGENLLRLEMADQGGAGSPRLRAPDDNGESGRGLHVVEALSLAWGAERRGRHTVVWAEFALGGRGPAR